MTVASEPVTRYTNTYPGMDTDPTGDWVDYDDHLAALTTVTKERDRLQVQLTEAVHAIRRAHEARTRYAAWVPCECPWCSGLLYDTPPEGTR